MLTREQKIDFLKCCIAAYEDYRVQLRHNLQFNSFCFMVNDWFNFKGLILEGDLSTEFIEFHGFISRNRTTAPGAGYYFSTCSRGWQERADVAREFLKQEYGITVPKRKK